ncbi:uncharacterized protein LOC143570214 [Bidens hawaiensis]|uniref:uncharacterized protein LOC143570214 n=1 Tax=Bidens hawaiensis TaxID=980011 RepID=UPI00404A0BD7
MDPNFTPKVKQGVVLTFDEWLKYNEYLQRQAISSQTLHTNDDVQEVVPETNPNPRKIRIRKGGALKKPNLKPLNLRFKKRLTCGILSKKSPWQELGLAKARMRQRVMLKRDRVFGRQSRSNIMKFYKSRRIGDMVPYGKWREVNKKVGWFNNLYINAKDNPTSGSNDADIYKGNFIEFLKVFGELSEEIGKVILGNAPGNNQMTSPSIKKEVCNCFAEEVLKKIFEELDDDVFSILVGFVKERFIGLVHVMETTALSLKVAINELFAHHNLSIGRHFKEKDQDKLNAVKLTDEGLKSYHLEGFDLLLEDVTSFCEKFDIEVVDMEAEYVDPRYRRKKTGITNHHYYVVNNFNTVIDMYIEELGNRFNEVTTILLTNMSSLSPYCNFSAFSKVNLLNLAEMYPCDFDFDEKEKLVYELGHYITNVKEDKRFANLSGLLSLVLSVATTSVERCFYSMKNVKTDLRNRMSDEYMNDSAFVTLKENSSNKFRLKK